ncbi:DMT family transporter [Rhodobacteraceae bacterium RKSG542]|nr:DMT family transporter [Pseudovibrio flavus]
MPENIQGVLWALLATALFAVTAALAKLAVSEYHVLQILFFRQLVVLASTLPAISRSFPQSLKTKRPITHALRMLGAFTALSCGIWAVAVLPLTAATTLGFSQVFFVALFAMVFLGEQVGKHRLTAILFGFIGVIIAMRPGTDGLFDMATLIPILGALGAGVAVICVRKLTKTETTATMLVYQASFTALLSGIPLFWLWQTPDLYGLMLLLGMGIIATAGQWVGIKALRKGEASVIGTIEYTKIVYAAILGFILFGEIPDGYTVIGAVIIVASSLYMLRREALKKREQK